MKYPTLIVAAIAGCSFPQGELAEPAIDRDAPRVVIESPARGTIAGDVTHVLVTGTASDDSGRIAAVKVNGVEAAVAVDGTWVVDVPLAPGTTLLRAIAFDDKGNRGEQSRAVVAGPMVDLDRHVDAGIRATLSSSALLTLGHSTATFMEFGGLFDVAQGMNPLVNVGPDCLDAQAAITSLTVGDADVVTAPTDGGIMVSVVLTNVDVGMRLNWSVACLDGSRDVTMSAERVTVHGLLTVRVVDRKLDIQLANPSTQVTGFDPQLAGVPDSVVDMLRLDTAVGQMIGSTTSRLVVSIAGRTLTALDDTRTVEVAGVPVEIDVSPSNISFSRRGGAVALETSVRARGDAGQFVFVSNSAPSLAMDNGFELAVADDAANQLLTSLWSANVFDRTVDLSQESIGELYDSVELKLMVPPHVNASAFPLDVTIGDWIATFKGPSATTVAIHATTALYVTTGADGKLKLAVSTPAVRIDVDDAVTKAQYDAIKEFAIQHVTKVASDAVGVLPLPTVGLAVPESLWVEASSGSMLVVGDLQEGGL